MRRPLETERVDVNVNRSAPYTPGSGNGCVLRPSKESVLPGVTNMTLYPGQGLRHRLVP